MLRFNLTLLCVFCWIISVFACQHEYDSGTNLIDGEEIMPGDTICLNGGIWNGIHFRNIKGTGEQPVVISNKNGVVLIHSNLLYGINFNNCSHIKLSGSGQAQFTYGIRIMEVSDENGSGLSMEGKSTDVEIEFIEISNVNIGGIYAKTEPDYLGDCSFMAVRDSFTMYNTSIHDCYLHDIGNEGMYIGSSKYSGQNIHYCNDTVVMPHVLEGVKVYNNILENIGWDGIQVSSAIEDCEIYNNTIIHDSQAEETFQMSGILIGGGSNCDCYNNKIIDGKGGGIEYLGMGNNRIFNNLILRPGIDFHPNDPPLEFQKHGIWIGEVITQENGMLYLLNNTIVSPRTFGVKLANPSISAHILQNNIILSPGAFTDLGYEAFIRTSGNGINFVESNNIKSISPDSMKFVDAAQDDYDLTADSPAVNNGISLLMQDVLFDIENRPRPFDEDWDIGAYECQDSSLLAVNESGDYTTFYYGFKPNPFQNRATVYFYLDSVEPLTVNLYNQQGQKVRSVKPGELHQGFNQINIHTAGLGKGLYVYEIISGINIYRGKAVKH